MKKFTLLAGIALLAGNSAFAVEEINGIKITNDTDTIYYRISNMRAQRLSYITGDIIGEDGPEDIVGADNAVVSQGLNLPQYLPDGEPTPEIYDFPYMGLSNLAGNWWVGFSAQEGVINPHTTYWYFTAGKQAGSVYIHNAVMDGTIRRVAQRVEGVNGVSRPTMGFDLNENRYYVIPAMEGPSRNGELTGMGINDQDWADDLTLSPEQKASAFALSVNATYTANDSYCLDMNNYITFTMKADAVDEYGDPIVNEETGENEQAYYGFAGVDRTWSPIRTTGVDGGNINHYANNGTLFFVTEQPKEDADNAKKAYADVIAKGFRDGAIQAAQKTFTSAISTMEGWANVPALWSNENALRSIIDYCANWNGDGLNLEAVHNLETSLAYQESAQKLADKKLAEAAALIGSGAIITLQNQLAFRDLEDWYNMDEAGREKYQLGNAYITAGGEGSVVYDGSVISTGYTAIVPTLEATEKSQWTLIPVPGTATFLLYNEATKTYIRQYKNMFEFADGENEYGEENSCVDFSWATTENKEEAAPFSLIGCPDPEAQTAPTPDEEVVLADNEQIANTDITNNVRLESQYTVVTPGENEGDEPTETTYTTHIFRTTASSGYNFADYGSLRNWWYADPTAYKVSLVKEGGISEITAENIKNNAVYDLQGRRVAKAGKGLFIINGVKTIVR